MLIDQFQNFKWRNKVQNWNLHEKPSKIGPFGNFNFWSKVNAKVKINESQSQWSVKVRVGSRFPGWATDRAADKLTSSYNVALTWLGLTWTCLRGCWRGMMTSFDDVRWHQQGFFGALLERKCSPARGGEARNPGCACRRMWARFTVGLLGL